MSIPSIPMNQGTGSCCAPAAQGIRLLSFPDGSQIGINGLDGILGDAYKEGKTPDRSVAKHIVTLLSKNNYIPSSAWSEYEDVVLKEYQKFLEAKKKG